MGAQSINDHGPHATHLYVNDNFRQYASGIFDDVTCPTTRTNHAVINVGYDTVEGYWLIQTLGVQLGVMVDTSKWPWARILVMSKAMLGYLKFKISIKLNKLFNSQKK